MPKYWGSLTDEDDALVDANLGAPVDFSSIDPDATEPVLVPPEAMRSNGTARQWYLTEGPGKDKNKGLSIPRATNVKPVESEWSTPLKVPDQDVLEKEVLRQGPVAQQAQRNLRGAIGAKADQQVAHLDEREAGLTLPREDEPWIEKGGFLGIQSPRLSTAIGGRANPILARALEDPSEKRVKFPSLEELQGVARSLGGTPEKVPSTPGEFVDTAVDTAIGQTIPGRLYQASKKFTAASGSLPKALYEYGETLFTPRIIEATKAIGDYGVELAREGIGKVRQGLNADFATDIERQRAEAKRTGETAPYKLPDTHARTMRQAKIFDTGAKVVENVAEGINTAHQAGAGLAEALITPTNLALMKAPGALTKLAKRGGEVSSITGLGETSVAQRLREGAAKAGAEHNAALAEAKTLKDAATASAVKQAGLETPEAVEGAWGGIRNLLTSDVNPGLVPGKGWWNSPMRTATTKRIKADILGTAAKTVVNEPLMHRAVGAYYTYQMAKELPQNFDRITQGGEEFFRTGDQKKLQEILPDVTSAAMLFMMAKHQLGQARGNLGGERFRTDKGIAEYRQRTRMPAYDLTDAKIQKDFVKEAFVGKRVVDHGDGLYGIRQGNSLDLARVKFVKPEDVKAEVDPATGEKKAHDAWITPPSAGAPPTIHLVAKTDMGLIKHEQTHFLTDMGALTGSLRDIEKELGLEHGAIQDTASIAKLRAELVERQATAPPEAQKNIADQIGRLDKAAKGIEAFPELVERTLGTSSSYEQSIEQIYKIKNGPMPNILDVFEKAKKGDREAMAEIKDRGLDRLYTDTMILGSPEQVAKARRNQWFETAKFLLTGKKSAADVARDIAEGRFDMTGAKPPNPLYSAEEIARGKEPVAEAPPAPAPVDAVGRLREVATQNAALKKQFADMDKAKAPVADMKPVARALDQSERDLHRAQADAAEQMKQHEEVAAKQLADLDKQIAAVDQSTNVGKLEARELKEKAETIHKELEELRGLMKKPAGPEPAPPPPVPGSVEEKQAFLDDTMAKMDATVEQTAQQLVKQQADEAKARTDIAQKMAEVGQKKVAEEVANREAARADIAKKMAEVVKGNAERVTSLSDVPSEVQGQRQTAQSWQARFEPAPEAGSERVGPVAPELGKSPDKFSMRTATGDLQRDMSERDKMFGMPQQGTDAPSAQHLGEVTLERLGIKTNEKVDGLDKAGTKWVPSGPEENSGTLVVANKDGTPGVVYKLSAGKILGAWNTSAKVDMWSEPTKRGPKGTIRNLLNKTAPDSLQRRAQAALAERGVKRFPAIETLSEYGIRSVDLFTPDQESMKLFRRWEKDPKTLVGKVEYQQGDSRAGQKLTLDQIKKGLSDLTKDSNAFTPESFAIHMREMDQVRDIYKVEGGGRLAVMAAGHNVPTREEANAGRDMERSGVALGRRAEEVGEPTPVGQGERAGDRQGDRAGDGGTGTDLGGGDGRFASRGAQTVVDAVEKTLNDEIARAKKRGGYVDDDAIMLVGDIRKNSGLPKEEFDKAFLGLLEDGTLQAHSHDRPKDMTPQEREAAVENGRGSYFLAAGFTPGKKPSGSPFPEAETPLDLPGVKFASRQAETPEFKKWFGDWQGDQGKMRAYGVTKYDRKYQMEVPAILYHSTDGKFNEFQAGELGFHLGDKAAAEVIGGSRTIKAYLNVRNPLHLPDVGVWGNGDLVLDAIQRRRGLPPEKVAEVRDAYHKERDRLADLLTDEAWDKDSLANRKAVYESTAPIRDALKEAGYDGIVYRNEAEGFGDSYIAFDPTQIKSATGNRGTFDPENPDIRYASRPSNKDPRKGLPGESPTRFEKALRRQVNSLERRLDAAYKSNAPQERIDAMEIRLAKLTEREYEREGEYAQDREPHLEEGIGIEETLAKDYANYLKAEGKQRAELVERMRDTLTVTDMGWSGTDFGKRPDLETMSDGQVLDAAKDAYEARLATRQKLGTRFAQRAAQLPPHLQAMADDLQRRRGIPGPRKRADLGEATAVTNALFDETWEMAEIERITKWREHPEYRDEWDSPVLVAKDAKSAGTENLFIKGVGSGGSKVKLSNGREVEVGPIILNRQTGKFEFATYVNSQGQTEYVSSLKSILSGMGKDKANRLNDFRQFQHALDLDAAGVEHGTGYTRAEMQAFVDAVRNDPRQADIVKKSEQLTAYFNSLGDYAVSKGAIDAGVWAALKKRWPNFSPMERLFEQETGGDGAGNKAGTGSPLRNVKGSKLPVVDEIWQAIDRTHRWISQVDRNMAAANLWRMQNSIEGALGGIAEPAKKKHTPLTPAQGLTPEGEIVTRRAKAQGKTLSVDEANQLGALIEPRHDFDKSTSAVSVVVDGKVKELQVDGVVRDFLTALNRVPDAPSNSKTVRALTALATHPTSFLKWMVTGMPAFQMAQLVRDPATGTMQTKGTGGLAHRLLVQPVSGRVLPLVEIARDAGRALGTAFGRVQDMDEARFQATYQRSAGMFSNMSAHDFETKQSVFNEIQASIRYGNKAGTAIHYLKPGELKWGHFLDNWLNILEKGKAPFESATRKAVARQTLKAGRNDLVAGTYARENTTNFATFGSAKWIRDANRFLPFLNAGLQSSRKFYLTMTGYDPITGKKSPKAAAEVMAKAFLWQTVPTMILWALNKGDDTIEEQRKGKNGLYYNYIRTPNIPELPEAIRGKVVAQPKAFTWSTVFSTIPEAMLDALYEEKPEYLEENLIKPVRAMFNKAPHVYDAQKEVDYKPLGRVAKGLGNELKAGGLSPWINAYLGLKFNTDPFYGGKIEMEYQRKMDAPLRQGYRTGQLSKDLSQGMFNAAEKIDDTKAAKALGTNVKGAVPGPDQIAFLANQVGLRDFYNLADRAYSEGTKREMPKGDYHPVQDLAGWRRFLPPENRGTGFASETFSEIAEKAETAVSSKKQLKKTDPLMLREYIEKRDIGFATAITKLKEKIDGLQQKRAKISQMMTKDPAERKRILDDLTNQIRGFQRRVIILTNDRGKKRGAE